jgi:hypothetical protein
LQNPENNLPKSEFLGSRPDDDAMSVYDDIPTDQMHTASPSQPGATPTAAWSADDSQDVYLEKREPAELIFCVILGAAYAGLARYLWALSNTGHWSDFIRVEGLFITLSLLALTLGLRPYLSPSSLQISNFGLKYRGPYWPQRKTINWKQIYRLYLSQDLIIVLYHPPQNPRGMRLLIVQCNYLADRDVILTRFARYSLVPPVYLKNPGWYLKLAFLLGYMAIVCWLLYMLCR